MDQRLKMEIQRNSIYEGVYDGVERLDDGKLYRAMRYMTIRQTQAQRLSKLTVRGGRQH